MGLNFMFSRARADYPYPPRPGATTFLPNPDPSKYTIVRKNQIGTHLLMEIQYVGCINYEGRKILVFTNCEWRDLKSQRIIDPHFSDNSSLRYPFARFAPTALGWEMAEILCYALLQKGGLR